MPRGYRVRRARASDLGALLDLETHFPSDRLTRAHWRHLLARAHADVLVVEDKTTIVGNVVVLYRVNSRVARVYSLVVHPAHRGRDLGNALMDAAERAARKHACHAATLELRARNGAARALYARRGYEIVGKISGFYDDGADALRMRKPFR